MLERVREKGILIHCWDWKLVTLEISMGVLKKLKLSLPYDWAIQLLGPHDSTSHSTAMCTALFTIAGKWNNLTITMWYTHTVEHTPLLSSEET